MQEACENGLSVVATVALAVVVVCSSLRILFFFFFFSSRRRHTRFDCDWSSDVCSSDLSRFVHERGKEGRLTRLVHHGFELVRRRYERWLDDALAMRWGIVAAAVLVMVAAWPLYQYSRRELAPIEDQGHISLFMAASPDASLAATNKASLQVVKAVRSFPEAKFMWSLTANWGGFGGMVAKNWKERKRTTEQMYGQLYYAVSQVPGLQVFPRPDPPDRKSTRLNSSYKQNSYSLFCL